MTFDFDYIGAAALIQGRRLIEGGTYSSKYGIQSFRNRKRVDV